VIVVETDDTIPDDPDELASLSFVFKVSLPDEADGKEDGSCVISVEEVWFLDEDEDDGPIRFLKIFSIFSCDKGCFLV
jgi:hypothetical protein